MSHPISSISNPFYDDFFKSPAFFHQQENLLAGQVGRNDEASKESRERDKELYDTIDHLS
jgi:hypothetical protein